MSNYNYFYNFFNKQLADGLFYQERQPDEPLPPPESERITEDSVQRITEDSQVRVTE
jgi:hypothetical protein